jgi:hypothetical protein
MVTSKASPKLPTSLDLLSKSSCALHHLRGRHVLFEQLAPPSLMTIIWVYGSK